jgi:hypothetical protein
VPEPLPPTEATLEVARRNVVLAVSLLGVALLIAAGAVVVAFVYLQFD